MLDGSLVISEFMAINNNTLDDEDGRDSDWIEIHNPTDATVNLNGWSLTDDENDLTKWQFPAVSIDRGDYLVVFASKENRIDPQSELHTNFKLDGDGEYLALVRPDGTTIAHEYAPEFPPQRADFSYGMASDPMMFSVPATAELTYLVPTPAQAGLGTDWTEPGFDDGTWTEFTRTSQLLVTEASTSPAFVEIQNVSQNAVTTSLWVVAVNDAWLYNINAVHETLWELPSEIGSGALQYRSDNSADPNYWGDDIPWRTQGPGWVMILDNAGIVVDFVVWGYPDESIQQFQVNVNGYDVSIDDIWKGSKVPGLGSSTNSLQRTGNADHDSAVDWAFVESKSMNQQNNALEVPFIREFATAVGFDTTSTDIGVAVQIDVEQQMYGQNGSLWARYPMNVDDPFALDTMQLRMKYNDAFVAYLNGVLVAESNAPTSPGWNAVATADREVAESLEYESFDLTPHLGLLQSGINVLAIHGLNYTVDDPDFLILPELIREGRRYFGNPTPGAANTPGFLDYVEDTKFDVDRGFFDAPFDVAITGKTPGATIRYTLDGSEPTETHGTEYTGPIRIDRTTTLRAAAFKQYMRPSDVDTQTYIFVDDVLAQSPHGESPGPGWPVGSVNGQVFDYGMDPAILEDPRYAGFVDDALLAIPSISLVTDLSNLFDPATGIYVNAREDGREWERPVSVELIDPAGNDGFQIDAGLRIRGAWSRTDRNPKHAFRLFFRSEYGDAKLEFPLFGDEGVNTFDTLDLRTSQDYSWTLMADTRNALVRDVFARDVQRDMGQPYTRSRYYHLYINGHYWGLYQSQERAEASFAESYFGGDKDDYDVAKVDRDASNVVVATDGTIDAYRRLHAAAVAGFADDADYYRVQGQNTDGTVNPAYERLLDVENLLDYMISIFYTGEQDGPVSNPLGGKPNNFFAIFNRNDPDGFKFFRHDAEMSLDTGIVDQVNPNRTDYGDQAQYFNPQWLNTQLTANAEYTMRFADRVHELFFNDGALTPQQSIDRLQQRIDEIDMAIIGESARWGDHGVEPPRNKLDDWLPTVNNILENYFPGRTDVVLAQFQGKGWYPDVVAPSFNQHGGWMPEGFELTVEAPAGIVYYTLDGSDPRLAGGAVSAAALVYSPGMEIPLTEGTVVKARALTGVTWSALNEAAFSIGQPYVAGRHVFYNRSTFDGDDPAANAADDNAIATDKQPLLPGGIATFANYTSYSRGINGIMVDIVGLPPGIVPDMRDFEFHVGNDDTPGGWELAPPPESYTLRKNDGVNGSDRVTIIWPDYTILNTWLKVTVEYDDLGLADDDIFYFGNIVAEAGNSATDAMVTAVDMLLARSNPRNSLAPAAIDFPYDFNRDGSVDATDLLLARNNRTNFLDALELIDLSSAAEAPTAMSPAELAWLSELAEQDRASKEEAPAETAVDVLLAMQGL